VNLQQPTINVAHGFLHIFDYDSACFSDEGDTDNDTDFQSASF
jgi:ssRNA-specific RNase YbeY (16S rRNA maturation enzyme)